MMSKKTSIKIRKKLSKKDLEFLENKIDREDGIKALKDIKKNRFISWDKVKADLNI